MRQYNGIIEVTVCMQICLRHGKCQNKSVNNCYYWQCSEFKNWQKKISLILSFHMGNIFTIVPFCYFVLFFFLLINFYFCSMRFSLGDHTMPLWELQLDCRLQVGHPASVIWQCMKWWEILCCSHCLREIIKPRFNSIIPTKWSTLQMNV